MLALKINNQAYEIANLKPKSLVNLGRTGFGLSDEEIMSAVTSLEANLQPTIGVLGSFENEYITKDERTKMFLVDTLNKRWNGCFKGITKYLEKNKK